ncbi:hypothetical protein LWF15_07200 [Kineosporia rhizophila]|uniref:hypothetical protein n=1 Tax=Kineosporia TaxID=49184 RepID=UPI001E31744C|nr:MULTISPECIES: hypothetical protein [Kineosporia]MCE0535291.1 hypothetical protein [Kineosporia rhizophila]GLY16929.1 hypothetical protein Kisp01_39440 [Kineosporia sp. NBRC 101677]
MQSPGVLEWIGLALQFVGLVLVLPGAFLLYRNTVADGRRRRAEGVGGYHPGDSARLARLVRAEEQDCGMPDTDRVRLSSLARTLQARRPLALLLAAGPLTAWGRVLLDANAVVIGLAVLMSLVLVAVVQIERQARDGKAFRQRFPVPVA